MAYSTLMKDDSWLVYKIALLRYSLHTLSFDKTIDKGECSPVQLWYTVISTESLLFQLVGDDYHLKIRSERPESYPERFRIQLDSANWEVECPEYSPPYYVAKEILDANKSDFEQGIMDSEKFWEHRKFYDWGLGFIRNQEQKPLNPKGRTGIEGRGALWLWGPNPMIYLIPIRFDSQSQTFEVLFQRSNDSAELINGHMRRHETLENASSRLENKIPVNIGTWNKAEIHSGYLYDPRQTDNAWVEGKAFIFYVSEENDLGILPTSNDQYFWKVLEPLFINDLYSTYSQLIRQSLQYLIDNTHMDHDKLKKLLDKTG
jgi:ADP-ribose pyrophosphatase